MSEARAGEAVKEGFTSATGVIFHVDIEGFLFFFFRFFFCFFGGFGGGGFGAVGLVVLLEHAEFALVGAFGEAARPSGEVGPVRPQLRFADAGFSESCIGFPALSVRGGRSRLLNFLG